MKKEARVVMLPTDKPTMIEFDEHGQLWYNPEKLHDGTGSIVENYQHLYIVDDSEIKEGDWCLFFWDGMINGELGQVGSKPQRYQPEKGHSLNNNLRKIIATTDPELYYTQQNGHLGQAIIQVPQIPQSFIESYCRKPVDHVFVEYEPSDCYRCGCNDSTGYCKDILSLTSNNELIIHPIEEKLYTKEEMIDKIQQYWDMTHGEGSTNNRMITWLKDNL